MTASILIDNMSPLLTGTKLHDTTDATNRSIILDFINQAKNQIAFDTLYWLGGEDIIMLDGINEYQLSRIPIQIMDIYKYINDYQIELPRNSADADGYYQTTPDIIYVNTPVDAITLNVNYYYYPIDYSEVSTVDLPPVLYTALRYFVAHQALEIYRSQKEMGGTNDFLQKYEMAIQKFIASTDNARNVDTSLEYNKISMKGLV